MHQRRMRVTDGLRSFQNQFELFKRGREETAEGWRIVEPKKVVTNAPAGFSFHAYGLAVDCAFTGTDPYLERLPDRGEFLWSEFGRLSVAHGLTWGGNFKTLVDRPHVEMPLGLSLTDCLSLYERGGIEAIWEAAKQS